VRVLCSVTRSINVRTASTCWVYLTMCVGDWKRRTLINRRRRRRRPAFRCCPALRRLDCDRHCWWDF